MRLLVLFDLLIPCVLYRTLHSGNLIGAGERRDGLYFFCKIPIVHVVSGPILSEFKLWHHRLGHPSDRVVKLVLAICASSFKKSSIKLVYFVLKVSKHVIVFLLVTVNPNVSLH